MKDIFDIRVVEPKKPASEPRLKLKADFKLPKLIYKFVHFIQLHRILSLALALLIFLGLLIPIAEKTFTLSRYKLSAGAGELLGSTSPKLATKISYDSKAELYQYNKQTKTPDGSNLPTDPSVSAGDKGYSADLYKDPSKGITLYDTVNNLSVSFTPQFKTLGAKQDVNRFIYPISGKPGQMIFTAKANGIKEDIILDKYTKDKVSYDYKLKLNDDLEARLNTDGSVGIYSADPTLFGNISFGSDQDREKVEQARKNGKKDHLAFYIPAPIIKQTGQNKGNPTAKFELKDNVLTVKAEDLKQASYPLSIDPTFIVTSSSDLRKSDGDGIDFDDTNNQIKRGGLTGGTIGSWSSASLGYRSGGHASIAYNGYLYVIGGRNFETPGLVATVSYASLNASTGAVGTFSTTSSFSNARYYHTAVAANGYLYIMGGADNNGVIYSDTQYAKVNSDGTLGSWAATSSFTTARLAFAATSTSGYVYIMGGCNSIVPITGNCGNVLSDTQYAKIKGDGTLGSWTSTNSFSSVRFQLGAANYNGYVYVSGGCNAGTILLGGCSVALGDTQYAKVNSDGTLTSWTLTGSSSPHWIHSLFIYNGYMYLSSDTTTVVQYAPIYASGSVGSWQTTTSLPTDRYASYSVAYNGYLYVPGGMFAGASDARSDIQYAKINPAGSTGNYSAINGATVMTTTRVGHGSVAMNGYIYAIAGSSNGSSTILSSVEYALINADGTLGTFATTASLNNTRANFGIATYNGFIYITGGCLTTCASPLSNTLEYAAPAANGTIASWTADITHTFTARSSHRSTVINNYLYVIGGCTTATTKCTALTTSVQVATLSTSSGAPSSFSTTTALPGAAGSFGGAIAQSGGYMYITGGCDTVSSGTDSCGNAVASTYYAKPNADGTIPASGTGSWQVSSNSFTTARRSHASVVHNGMLYILGGSSENAATRYGDVQFAPISSTGDLGPWATTTSMPDTRLGHTAVANNGYLYVLGGGPAQAPVASYSEASINNGGPGTLGTWTTDGGTSFASGRYGHGSVAANGYLYVIGGCNNGTSGACAAYLNSVQYAPINNDGSIGTWAATSSFITARWLHGTVYANGYIYIVGGVINVSGVGGVTASVEFAKINSDGTIPASGTGAWAATTSLPTARLIDRTVTTYNGYIYVLGDGFTAEVRYAKINSDGTIPASGAGSWTATSSYTTGRISHSVVAYKGYMYLLGGCPHVNVLGGCDVFTNDVQYAPINSDGTVGTWGYTSYLPDSSYSSSAVVYNGNIYISGGVTTAGAFTTNSIYVPILSSGQLGNWTTTNLFSGGRYFHPLTTYNGFIYVAGGYSSNCTTDCRTDVQYAPLQSTPRVGKYSRLLDCELDCTPTKLLTRGSLGGTDSIVTNNYSCATNASPTFGSLTTSTLSLGNLLTIPYQIKRYCWLSYILDDTNSAVFPDSNQTSLTDFKLYYHPASAKRLRGGKTFTGGTQQSLDAQP